LECSCHAVERIPSPSRGRTAQFVPIRFVFRNKLNRDDKLLLAFDARVLSEALSREAGLGKIVHGDLMRDLNDAVLDNPYDEDVKRIVTGFAELLRGIVKTIDRWGLKSRFLHKHLVEVARFYKRISKTGLSGAAASKWKDRLEKDQAKLFTFLSHDDVPWNNNNAEHAIKAFARFRRAIEGLSTPNGIEEYLILLSVCQTCKYSGLDFLDFLRSGETDVRIFAANQWN
jgi:hypothetical protein